ncbi:UDP-N-acetylmuramate dehydrogenase [Dyadobacter sp. CY312]|uniref:UDP-N-acetylmuramate dehydrogenase n=1 Tax=Dyadobacter sp. CY312 TaxID=2907303 RepID=UPI001F2C69FC|nr:UDP-N-acetylmuramate dehydrogenase [Dyadobacter sp. CY312]MCE7040502.1 UDP-N-acetylmuramate dehydrogenase [Dyadobacter sp. CY312]
MKTFQNFDLTDYNSYKIKAVCKTAYFPDTDDDIHRLFSNVAQKKILLGGGYNVLLSKDYYDTEFVIFSGNYNKMELVGEESILCEAGCDMKELSEFALSCELSGLEIFFDIPSSLGGAVVMNAGAGGEDIQTVLDKVWYYNPGSGRIEEITKEEIGFEYRNSFFQKNPEMIVCRTLLSLKKNNPSVIREKMDTIKAARWAKQPREFPNAGSVFKRPPGRFVGPMIDELGLKGYTVGGAKISEKHSGFIVNCNNACGHDIIAIIVYVKERIRTSFGVELDIEQRII